MEIITLLQCVVTAILSAVLTAFLTHRAQGNERQPSSKGDMRKTQEEPQEEPQDEQQEELQEEEAQVEEEGKTKKKKNKVAQDDEKDEKEEKEGESLEKKRGFSVSNKEILDPMTKKVLETVEMICIESKDLRNTLRTWIQSDDFYRDRPTIELNTIIQYIPDIKTYFKDNPEDTDSLGKMQPLIDYLELKTKDFFEQTDKMIADGKISFYSLWYLFQKNTKISYDNDGILAGAFVFERQYMRNWYGTSFGISASYITSNGKHFFSSDRRITIHHFLGLKDIKKLNVQPISAENLKYLHERGKKYESIALGICYKQYTGNILYRYWMHSQQYKADGRIMIDAVSFKKMNPNYEFSSSNSSDDALLELKSITDENYFTTDPTVYGFSFSNKKWGEFFVDDITDIQFREDAFENLVLPKEKKHLIRALVERSANTFADMITGKGGGCIFLLHGNPGVGKTLTAEAIAELLHRPLYSISVGELGTTTATLEEKLREILEVASYWNAVILLDEADIFLEARNENDIKRNAMVGQFLRLLEYHSGVLFLTTNRVKCFDKAFHSRISIALKYQELDAAAREQIWVNFFKMANVSGIDPKELSKYELNGRQIKNSIRLAQSLAQEEGCEVKLHHLQQCIATSQQFNDDLQSNSS